MAGTGNNGGDGFVAAPLARRARLRGAGAAASAAATLRGDAALAAQRWSGATAAASPERLAAPTPSSTRCSAPGLDRPVEGERARGDRGDERGGVPGLCGRPAERHQRHDRRGDGRSGDGDRDRDVLPRKARPSAAAGAAALRAHPRLSTSAFRRACSSSIRPRHSAIRQHSGSSIFRAAPRRPQIHARPCGRAVGRHRLDRRGAACGARRAAGGGRPGDDRVAARGAGGQRGGEPGGDGASGR